jgi:hypothetical protein
VTNRKFRRLYPLGRRRPSNPVDAELLKEPRLSSRVDDLEIALPCFMHVKQRAINAQRLATGA